MKKKKFRILAVLLLLSILLLIFTCKKTISLSSRVDDIKQQVEMSH